ncbi:hypothetical protein MD484_g5249, partial [Candolleomyces efflorescens]
MASQTKQQIIVLGAGVIGLTTALKIQSELGKRLDVVLIGEILPTDPKNIKYTSQWAVANLRGIAELEVDTFKVLWDLSAPGSDAEECLLRIHEEEYFADDSIPIKPFENMPDVRAFPFALLSLNHLYRTPAVNVDAPFLSQFKRLEQSQLPTGVRSGISFTTLTIDTPLYLNYLLNQFIVKGGRVLRGTAQHIHQVIEGGVYGFPGGPALFGGASSKSEGPAAVINCTGIGARFLGGVEDKKLYPLRGQTIIVRAPWVRSGKTFYKDRTGAFTYIIPRRSGEVIVGGTRAPNDWYAQPRPETTEDILQRGFAFCPDLASPEIRSQREPTIDDVRSLIVAEGCGLRPSREGGIRLEVEWTEGVGGRGRVPVVHNYGHGGTGFQASWASADIALRLLEESLARA